MTAVLKPTGSAPERFTSRNPDDFPVPNRSQEDWRFSPLARIREFFEPFEPDGVIEGDQRVPDGAHVDVVDPTDARRVRHGADAGRPGQRARDGQRHARAARARRRRCRAVRADRAVPQGHQRPRRTPITSSRSAPTRKATLVIDHRGLIQVAANIEFIVGDGASLRVVAVNSADEGSVQLSSYAALVGRDATYRHVNITLGGSVVRIVPDRALCRPGRARRAARCQLRRRGPALREPAVRRPLRAELHVRTCCTRTRCSASRHAPCGSATCASGRPRPAPTPTR